MNTLAKISLLLVILLVSLSAYLRLAHSGIGCADWPECYGLIGPAVSISQPATPENAYRRMVEQANQPMAWATPLHRLVASVLGLLIVFLVFIALRRKKQRIIALALLGLTVFLAVLGIRSGSLHNPAVVMGNLAGGFTMLGLLGWMVFRPVSEAMARTESATQPVGLPEAQHTAQRATPAKSGTTTGLAVLAIVVLCLQIVLGGLTSANFAATSCRTLPDCHGSWVPGHALFTAFDLSRQHKITPMGQAIGGEERLAIHKAHRIGAVITVMIILLAALSALRSGARYRTTAIIILVLVALEFLVGIAAILTSLPIGLAVAHNWLAGLVLLALLRLAALARISHENGLRL
jgi:cytochrome c oxidase assembly protein subunit 15